MFDFYTRKNFLFLARADAGGERAEVFVSLVQSCKRLGIEPFKYLQDVLGRITTHAASQIHELTPKGWLESCARAEIHALASAP